MARKKSAYFPFFGLAILVGLITAGGIFYLQQFHPQVPAALPLVSANTLKTATTSASLQVASASASPSAAPKPTIPYNYGHSVRVPILMYHYIGNNPNPADKARDALSVAPDKFDDQLGYLVKNGYTAISPETFYAALKGGSLPAKPVMLTFDDGYVDFFINAFPIIEKYHLHVVSFIPTGLMNQGYYLSWDQIRQMQTSGLISFEAHSVNHVNLAALSGSQLVYQISESRKVLAAQIGAPVDFFAYPYGTSNQEAWRDVQAAGYKAAFGTWTSAVESEGTLFDLPRIKVSGAWTIADFGQRL